MRSRKREYIYEPVAADDGPFLERGQARRFPNHVPIKRRRNLVVMSIVAVLLLIGLLFTYFVSAILVTNSSSCDTIYQGYQCQPLISHFWGQYSPFFTIPSEIPTTVPDGCQITFAQILSRHGARDPTASKTASYNATIQKIQSTARNFSGDYAFLADYVYTLGADQLTLFGEQQMINSGISFYERYEDLAKQSMPFVRSSGETRVVVSAQNFTQGFHLAKVADKASDPRADNYPYPIVVISEDAGSNNTLSHGLCSNFENGYDSKISSRALSIWAGIFTPEIMKRINLNLPGANISTLETISLMDLCPFNTVASPTGQVSPFCALFTEQEWHAYDYYQSLGKYYGYGSGNPLGPTQGVGFTNELIARMTGKPVDDHTSVNHTLDDSQTTFPIGSEQTLYADFSHDNDMTAIFSALGLYNATAPLSNTSIASVAAANGYSASWTVPFAARAYFEKMTCSGIEGELVRVIVNDRVVPLQTCGADSLGRCTLGRFIDSLSFAAGGGDWGMCFDGGGTVFVSSEKL